MKLTKQFLTYVVLATSSFALNIKISEPNFPSIENQIKQFNLTKRKVTISTFGEGEDPINPFGQSSGGDNGPVFYIPGLSENCTNFINNYNEYSNCLLVYAEEEKLFSEKTADGVCSIFNQNKCQKFYHMNIFDSIDCKEDDVFLLSTYDYSLKRKYLTMSVNCSKDENGKYCPLTEVYLNTEMKDKYNKSNMNETELLTEVTQKTCESEKCTSPLVKFFIENDKFLKEYIDAIKNGNNTKTNQEDINEILSEIEKAEKEDPLNVIRDYLNSEKCPNALTARNEVNSPSTGFSSIIPQYSSTLLVTFILLLFTL